MATAAHSATNPTLLDQIKRRDPDGQIADVAEVLEQDNPVLKDMTVLEGNLMTGHQLTIRAGLPSVYWRYLNRGILPSKSTTEQYTETCGRLEARSNVDVGVAELNGDQAAFRASEDDAFIQAMNHEAMAALFYGNTVTDPEQMDGFAPRYDDLDGGNADNIVNFTDITGDDPADSVSSMWLICWGPKTCFGVFPKGTMGGLEYKDLGMDYVDDGITTGAQYLAWRSHWTWRLGLCIKDWRYVVRGANIDFDHVVSSESSLIELMTKMYHRIHNRAMGRCVFYATRAVAEYLDIQVLNKGNAYLTAGQWHGIDVTTFRGIPILTCDGLLDTETIITT